MNNTELTNDLYNVINIIVKDPSVPIITVFADKNYKDVVRNWHAAIKKLDIKNYIVISLDIESFNYFVNHKITTFLIPFDSTQLSNLWVFRLQILTTILQKFNIIHSDADAIWLKDPIPQYFLNTPFDFICSQGTIHPFDIYQKWGFVMCCGLFYVKSNPKTITLFKSLCEQVTIDKDDQITLNRYFHNTLQIKWKITNLYLLPFHNNNITCSESLIQDNGDINAAILPQHLFQRLEIDISPNIPYVKHILSNKNNEDKFDTFANTNCLFIPRP